MMCLLLLPTSTTQAIQDRDVNIDRGTPNHRYHHLLTSCDGDYYYSRSSSSKTNGTVLIRSRTWDSIGTVSTTDRHFHYYYYCSSSYHHLTIHRRRQCCCYSSSRHNVRSILVRPNYNHLIHCTQSQPITLHPNSNAGLSSDHFHFHVSSAIRLLVFPTMPTTVSHCGYDFRRT